MSSDWIEVKQQDGAETKSAPLFQLAAPSDDFLSLFGVTPTTSGMDVSPISAMRVPAVRGAVMAISEAIGQADVHVYQLGDGAAQKAPDHPAYPLLHDAANDWTSAGEFREQVTRDALLYGNGYAFILRDDDGTPVELSRMQPDKVSLLLNLETLEPYYRYTPLSGDLVEYTFRDVLHLRTSSLNGYLGESPIYQAREAIGLAMTMEAHAGRLFANGARPASSLNVPGILTPEAVARLNAAVAVRHAGSASGSTFILENGAKFEQLAFSSVDAQFMELRTFAISEIARVFRISPILLAEMGRATFANSAEMGKQFIAYTLLPWVKRWQGEVALKLFTPGDRKKYRIEFDTDDFDRLDLGARATGYASMIAARVMNPNECRELEGLPPYPAGADFINPNIANVQERVSVG